MTTRVPDARRSGIADSVVDAIDAGAAAGTVEIRSGSQPADADDADAGTLLATVTLADPAFGAASAGVATASASATVQGTAAGTAGHFRVKDSNGNKVLDGSVGTSGADMIVNTTTISVGVDFDITSWTVTAPA